MGPKMPLLRPENGKDKVLPFLGIFRGSIFVTARFCGGFWATNSVICVGCFFAGSGCAFLYGISYLIQGVLVFAVLGTLGPLFRGSSSLLFLLLLPLSPLGAGSGSLLCFLCLCRQDSRGRGRSAWRLMSCHVLFFLSSFFLPLSARAGSPLPFPVSFSLSLSL